MRLSLFGGIPHVNLCDLYICSDRLWMEGVSLSHVAIPNLVSFATCCHAYQSTIGQKTGSEIDAFLAVHFIDILSVYLRIRIM